MDEKDNDPFSKKMGITPIPTDKKEPSYVSKSLTLMAEDLSEKEEVDFLKSREAITDAMETAKEAMDSLLEIARASETPRAFEVLALLIKTQSEVASDLVKLNIMKKDSNGSFSETNNKIITNNNLLVGNANDLLKMIKNVKENTRIIDQEEDKE